MQELKLEHTSGQRTLLVDPSKVSMKAVLLRNGNKFPSIPQAHAINVKETYEILQVELQKIRHEEHRWNICADLKVIEMLTSLQSGYTKFCCF
jgi:hypothetical protein